MGIDSLNILIPLELVLIVATNSYFATSFGTLMIKLVSIVSGQRNLIGIW